MFLFKNDIYLIFSHPVFSKIVESGFCCLISSQKAFQIILCNFHHNNPVSRAVKHKPLKTTLSNTIKITSQHTNMQIIKCKH